MRRVSSICCQRKRGVNVILVCFICTRFDCICAQNWLPVVFLLQVALRGDGGESLF